MEVNKAVPSIDVGIITIKPEEYSAVIERLPRLEPLYGFNHQYFYQPIVTQKTIHYNIAIARCLEQGEGWAQSLAEDMVNDLNPTWLFLVGIAGGVPAAEYSLGDVLICTRLYDFSVCCISEDTPIAYSSSGGPMHPDAARLLEALPAYASNLKKSGWNTRKELHRRRPSIDLFSPSFTENFMGDEKWQRDVIKSLERNFSKPRKPNYHLGPTGSSDRLMKSPSFLKGWLNYARSLVNVEMELGGVYRVAHKNNIPVLAIRGLSDIVGYKKRSPEWTEFACETAASFALNLVREGLLSVGKKESKTVPQIAVPKNQLDNRQISLDDTFKLLPYESPFQTGGTISFRHPSYVLRKSDIDLEALLKNNSFICLQGDFGYGKSSLLMRVPDMLPHGWEPIEQKFDLQKTGGMDSIEKAFFERLKKVDIKLQDWVSVGEYLKRNKLIFLIDEIIFCSDQIAAKFIRKIYALVEDAPSDHVRVILTFRGSLRDHIGEIGLKNPILKNPKYRDCWKIVELTPLEESDLIKLLKLFPQPVDIILQEKLSTIKKCTLMGPRDVQKLCDGLWMRLRRKTIPANEINGQVQSYLEEYERYEGK